MPIRNFVGDSASFARAYNERKPVDPACWADEYVGCVLTTWEKNGYDDSDWYAVVWDEATQSCKSIIYATTRGATLGSAEIDATPEVIAKAQAWLAAIIFAGAKEAAAKEALTPELGKTVEVVKGRKVPKGTVGVVTWKGLDDYKSGRFYGREVKVYRLGIKVGEQVHFTAAENCKVIDPEEWIVDLDSLRRRAERAAASECAFSSHFAYPLTCF
jgi:hypothetical protein